MIASLKEKLAGANFFYLTDSSGLTVAEINKFRGLCYEKGIKLQVVKNTLLSKALEALIEEGNENLRQIVEQLKGPTSLMVSDNPKIPALLIKEFREDHEKPVLKAAYIDNSIYVGDDQLEALTKIKTKEEVIGDIILLLQSPAKNVISALKSSGATLSGLLKALEERAAS